MRKFALLFVSFLSVSCSVKPYSVRLSLPQQTLFPASPSLITTDSGLSTQLERTTLYCSQAKQAISTEADQRQTHLGWPRLLIEA